MGLDKCPVDVLKIRTCIWFVRPTLFQEVPKCRARFQWKSKGQDAVIVDITAADVVIDVTNHDIMVFVCPTTTTATATTDINLLVVKTSALQGTGGGQSLLKCTVRRI